MGTPSLNAQTYYHPAEQQRASAGFDFAGVDGYEPAAGTTPALFLRNRLNSRHSTFLT